MSRLCEMFVGVICACMPAAAYAARQSNSPYRYIYNTVISFGSAKFASKSMERSTTTSHTAEGYSQPGALKSTDRKYAQYFNLTDMSISKTGDGEGNIGTTAAISSQGQTNSASLGIWRQVEVDLESGVRRP